jgi:hypothetical protein
MTLLDAPKYDPARDRRRMVRIIVSAVVILVLAVFAWFFRYWPEEHVVNKFFAAIQKQDYENAYGIWMHDPQWKEHPAQYARYPYKDFYTDWGPGGEWGLVKSFEIYASGTPPGKSSSGIIVEVIVNGRAEHARVWVDKSDKTLGFSPY